MKSPHKTSGFNLLEVVVATLLFNLVVVFSIGLWATHARTLEKSRHRMVATFLAEQTMENALAEGFYGVKNGADTIAMKTTVHGTVTTVKYDYSVEVAETDDPNLKSIVVKVKWPDDDAQIREVRYETLLSSSSN
ncbi:MAG: hypothetical protein HY319_17835 [Armatimonadetes bacterium]|nr:hypothetical protein [Armatimonadota bacterium]